MALYAVGDIQGCLDDLERLVAKIRFDPARDTLWFTGDLVNRGPRSADTLRFVRSLGPAAVTVLGNHDLHLLAVASGHGEARGKDTVRDVLDAPDAGDLIDWLRRQPMAWHDDARGLLLVHAGVHPDWSTAQCLALAGEVETVLRGDHPDTLFSVMYGNDPRHWDPSLAGDARLRFITNVLTRMRYLKADNKLTLKFKGAPSDAPPGQTPWFLADHHARRERVVFGHWSSLGVLDDHGVIGLDSGCLWGRALTAVALDDNPRTFTWIDCSDNR